MIFKFDFSYYCPVIDDYIPCTVKAEYCPFIPATLEQPSEGGEIQIVEILDKQGIQIELSHEDLQAAISEASEYL